MTKRLGRGDWFFVRDDGNLRVPPNLVLGVAASVIATTQLAADPTSPVAAPADHADRYIDDADVSFSPTTGGNHRAAFDGFHNKDPRQTVDKERLSRTGSRPLSWICFSAECVRTVRHDFGCELITQPCRPSLAFGQVHSMLPPTLKWISTMNPAYLPWRL